MDSINSLGSRIQEPFLMARAPQSIQNSGADEEITTFSEMDSFEFSSELNEERDNMPLEKESQPSSVFGLQSSQEVASVNDGKSSEKYRIDVIVPQNMQKYDNEDIQQLKNAGYDVRVQTLSKDSDKRNQSILADSLKNADYILIRSHGGRNKAGNFTGFEGTDGISYLNPSDIRKALSEAGNSVRTKMIFADACGSANVKDEKFINALKEKNITYIGSTNDQLGTNSPLEFVSNCIKNSDVDSNLKILNGKAKSHFIKLP